MKLGLGAALAGALAMLSSVNAEAQSEVQTSPSASSSSSATSSAGPVATAAPGCPSMVIDQALTDPLPFYNEFLREVGHSQGKTAPHSLHIAIADCDDYYYYLDAADLKPIMEPTPIYAGGRAAVKLSDAKAVTLASLVPPPPPPPSKPGKKSPSKKAAAKPTKPAAKP